MRKQWIGTVALLAAATAARADVTLYQDDDFQGRAVASSGEIPDLKSIQFNDQASSLVIRGERWTLCSDAGFKGQCVSLGPGRYPSLSAMGLNDRLSSLRPEGGGGWGQGGGQGRLGQWLERQRLGAGRCRHRGALRERQLRRTLDRPEPGHRRSAAARLQRPCVLAGHPPAGSGSSAATPTSAGSASPWGPAATPPWAAGTSTTSCPRSAASTAAGQRSAIELYEHANFEGRSLDASRGVEDLGRVDFNDRAVRS
jgi:hypothetical protein